MSGGGEYIPVGQTTDGPAAELARLRAVVEQSWDITPRGRLALLCHQAVTAGMVST